MIFEITSKATASEDIAKTSLYASLGVREYFLFDPLEEYLEKGPMGFRLDGLMYTPVIPEKDGTLFSEELGLKLIRDEHILRLTDPETGCPLLSIDEAVSLAEKEAQKAARLAAKLRKMGIDPESV